ncbi:MAG TPA: tetratricopeptide repeat protein [Ignavibacteriaceae bacterium]|nr:tetratricopeptide repeat protein [Ignavibacteriaceae bacterium]
MLKSYFLLIFFSFGCAFAQQNDFASRYKLGQSFLQAGKYNKAKAIFEDLYKIQPDNYQIFTILNDSYIQLKDYDSSISLIEDRIKKYPQDITLYGMLGSTYYLMGNENKAFETWDNAAENMPNRETSYRVLANYAMERRAFEKGIEYLRKGKSYSQNPIYFSFDLGNLYSLTMQFKKAAEEYCFILSTAPEQISVIKNRIQSYINKPGALQQTIGIVKDWEKHRNINFTYLLADLYKEAKEYNKAFEQIQIIENQQNHQGAVFIKFAYFLLSENQYPLAAKVYNKIIDNYPKSPYLSNARLGYAKTLEATLTNDSSISINHWKPYHKPVSISGEKVDKVIDAYEEITRIYKHSETANEALYRIGLININIKNNSEEAEKYFNEVIVNNSSLTPDANLELGNIYLQKGKLDKATIYYSKIIDYQKTTLEKRNLAKFKLARINFYKGNFDQSQKIISEIINNLNDNTANDALELSLLLNTAKKDSSNLAKFALGEFLVNQNKFSDASKIFAEIAADPRVFILNGIADLRVAELHLAFDSLKLAIAEFSKIADNPEKNIYADKALYLEAKTYQLGLNDNVKAIESFGKLLEKFPNSIYLDESRKTILELKNKIS